MKIVLLTRTDRPSGAIIAQAIKLADKDLVAVIAEKRSSLITKKQSRPNLAISLIKKHGLRFILFKIFELLYIKLHFFMPYRKKNYLSIQEVSRDYDLNLHLVGNHNSSQTKELLEKIKPDIIVLTNTGIIKPDIYNQAKYSINIHSSLLPKYRGLDSIFWALYNEESKIGVSIHFVDKDLDKGDIILQEDVQVSLEDDEKSLYKKVQEISSLMIIKVLIQLENETYKRKPQVKDDFKTYSWPTKKQRRELKKKLSLRKKSKLLFKNDKVRILHVITRMVKGGAQENTLLTILGLRKKGYHVDLITGPTYGAEGEIETKAKQKGIDLIKVSSLLRNISPLNDIISLIRLYFIIKKGRYHIVHTHTSKAGVVARLAAKLAGVSVIVHTPHGHIFHSYFGWTLTEIFLNLERIFSKFTDKIITLTDNCKQEHIDLNIADSSKFLTVHSGVEVDRFLNPSKDMLNTNNLSIHNGKKVVGTVTRLVPVKGVKYFLDSIHQILKEYPDVRFLIVGDGWQKADLEHKMIEEGLIDNVTFSGVRDDVPELMSGMDLFVLPSLNEGMGRVLVEAGIMGKACIATKVSGIPELIEDGRTGLLVQPKDSSGLAKGILKLLKDPDLADKMGKAAREKMLNGFSSDIMVERIDGLYKDLLNEKIL